MIRASMMVMVASGLAVLACGGVDVPTAQDQEIVGVDDSTGSSSGTTPANPSTDDHGKKVHAEGDTGEDGLTAEIALNGEFGIENQVENQTDPNPEEAVAAAVFANGSSVQCTAPLNLRAAASITGDVLRTMPEGSVVKVVDGVASDGFIKVEHNGLQGYAAYRYLEAAAAASGTPSGTVRDAAIEIAASGVGFTYWWGHGKWQPSGATSSNKGTCKGACPSCTHGGAMNGADCSGFVAKVWKVPSSNTNLTTDEHPYSTADFFSGTGGGQWSKVSKSAIKKGDALVYRSGGSGHIVIYEKGDAWGQPWTYEARGCSYGIVHNVRTVSSGYKGITRSGW